MKMWHIPDMEPRCCKARCGQLCWMETQLKSEKSLLFFFTDVSMVTVCCLVSDDIADVVYGFMQSLFVIFHAEKGNKKWLCI
jgi:hypothetical protein